MSFKQYKDWHGHGRMLCFQYKEHDFRVYIGFKNIQPIEFQHRTYTTDGFPRVKRLSHWPVRPGQQRVQERHWS